VRFAMPGGLLQAAVLGVRPVIGQHLDLQAQS
jgi:hypothetical protein